MSLREMEIKDGYFARCCRAR